MYQDQLKNVTKQLADATAPAKQLGALMVENLEKLSAFQLETAKSCAELNLQQLRAALEVRDAKSLQAFVSQQQKVAGELNEKLSADVKTLSGLGEKFGSELQKITKDSLARAGKAA
ncbi:phasin family protein [Alkalilimnicola sp. S0819]|uniref:phasin family protein n=1 Tax=Alkalilimnicola sp. S0819 TaxID=2613922 RepID=UPI00186998AD|nr:phasin family protein [Alkalilimnicola sp. S0819]